MTTSVELPRRAAYGLGAGLTLALVGALSVPASERFYSPGTMNTGHEALDCAACHERAAGTARQQIQANLRHLVGRREFPADFIHKPVKNANCESCHPSAGDTHPAYRFNEPRFADVRKAIGPQLCVSCHREHNGRRVTVDATFCASCHPTVTLRKGSIEPSHDELIANGQWDSCMRCHDYHGRHEQATPRRLPPEVTAETIRAYFAGGPSPYGPVRAGPAKAPK
jgi:hypothetical protein